MGTATILGITRGGGQWATTDVAGIRITDGGRGAEPPSPMYTESGAIQHIRAREQPGQIPTPGITELPAVVPITTPRPAGAQLRDVVTTPTSTLGTPLAIAAVQPTTRTLELWLGAARDMLATSIAAKAQQIAGVSYTTPTRMRVSLLGRTTSMRARTGPCTATIGIAVVGRAIAATAGNRWTSHNQRCEPSKKCEPRARKGCC